MNLGEILNIAGHDIEDCQIRASARTACLPASTGTTNPSSAARPIAKESSAVCSTTSASWTCATPIWADADGGAGNVLGDAYEYLINQFADDAGKKGGEFYTPRVRLFG